MLDSWREFLVPSYFLTQIVLAQVLLQIVLCITAGYCDPINFGPSMVL